MEHGAGVGPGGLGSVFLLRLPRFLKVLGTRFRAAAGNTYVLAVFFLLLFLLLLFSPVGFKGNLSLLFFFFFFSPPGVLTKWK